MGTIGRHWKLSKIAKKHISEGHKGIKAKFSKLEELNNKLKELLESENK
jgi:hypothetical protein